MELVQKKGFKQQFQLAYREKSWWEQYKNPRSCRRFGKPVYFQLSKGNLNDNVLSIDVLSHVDLDGANILGDKSYGTAAIREYITGRNATYTIPPEANTLDPWEYDGWVYKERNLVECFFNKLKHFRKITTRYDKLSTSFLAFIYCCSYFYFV
jgi:transposase